MGQGSREIQDRQKILLQIPPLAVPPGRPAVELVLHDELWVELL
jgi:hypothetical protein